MKFRYKNYGQGFLRPVIPIEIIYRNQFIQYEALIDSGADFCIFDAQIGELLGIDIDKGEKREVWGITGVGQSYYVHQVDIKIGRTLCKIKAGFLPEIAKLGCGVLGQRGFFDIFVVKFDLLKEEIELKTRR